MAITVICNCGKQLQVKDEYAGRKGKCSSCGCVIAVPTSHEVSNPFENPTWKHSEIIQSHVKDSSPLPIPGPKLHSNFVPSEGISPIADSSNTIPNNDQLDLNIKINLLKNVSFEEVAVFDERDIRITTKRLIVSNSKIFELRHLVSIKQGEKEARSGIYIFLLVLGSIAALAGLGGVVLGELKSVGAIILAVALLTLVLSIVAIFRLRPTHWLAISFTSGEKQFIADLDLGFINRVREILSKVAAYRND